MCCSSPTPTQTVQQNYDPVASKKMADIAEKQWAMSEEQWNMSKEIFQPYTEAMVKLNQELLPLAGEMSKQTIEEATRDIEQGREVKDALRAEQLKEIGLSGPVAEKFYQQATEGVDIGERMGMATADVQQAFKGAEGTLARNAARMGLKPTASMIKDIALEQAKAVGGARNTARIGAENENWGRLQTGMAARGRATGLPGTQVQPSSGQTQYGNYGLSDPANQAVALSSQAGSTTGLLASRPTSSTTTTTGTGGSWTDFLGSMVGMGGGAFMGGLGSSLGEAAGRR